MFRKNECLWKTMLFARVVIFVVFMGSEQQALVFLVRTHIRHFRRFRRFLQTPGPLFGRG